MNPSSKSRKPPETPEQAKIREAKQARRKRTAFLKTRQRMMIAGLYSAGYGQKAIALQLGITESMVSRDIDEIEAQWLTDTRINFDLARKRELETLNAIEMQAWEAWLRSRENAETNEVTISTEKGRTIKKKSVGQAGDSRFLDVAIKCSIARSKLLGLIVDNVDLTTGGQALGTSLAEGMAKLFNEIGQREKALAKPTLVPKHGRSSTG